MTPRLLAARDAEAPVFPAMLIRSSPSQRTGPSYKVRRMHENRNARWAPMRVAGRPIRKTEVLGLLIFVLMAAVMFAVGAALFYDWLAARGDAGRARPGIGDPLDCRGRPGRGPRDGRRGDRGALPDRALHALQCRAWGIKGPIPAPIITQFFRSRAATALRRDPRSPPRSAAVKIAQFCRSFREKWLIKRKIYILNR